jgi:hypothetical protein
MLTCAEADAEVKKRNKSAPAMAKLQAMRGVRACVLGCAERGFNRLSGAGLP